MLNLLQIDSHQMLQKIVCINQRSEDHCKGSNKTINNKISEFISSADSVRL
jgi:hypothetical protein